LNDEHSNHVSAIFSGRVAFPVRVTFPVHVTTGIEGPPDRRSDYDREQAAKNQLLALSREFAEARGE
jgi:hypothetical protein